MHESTLQRVRSAVSAGLAPNASAFVEEAVIERLRALRRVRRYASYAAAAEDREFMSDLSALTRELETAVADGLEDAD